MYDDEGDYVSECKKCKSSLSSDGKKAKKKWKKNELHFYHNRHLCNGFQTYVKAFLCDTRLQFSPST